jgi:hypothetical protein
VGGDVFVFVGCCDTSYLWLVLGSVFTVFYGVVVKKTIVHCLVGGERFCVFHVQLCSGGSDKKKSSLGLYILTLDWFFSVFCHILSYLVMIMFHIKKNRLQ